MKYLNSTDIETLHSSWVDTIQVIKTPLHSYNKTYMISQ